MLWRFSKVRTWALTSDCCAVLKRTNKQKTKTQKNCIYNTGTWINTFCNFKKITENLQWLIRFTTKFTMLRVLVTHFFASQSAAVVLARSIMGIFRPIIKNLLMCFKCRTPSPARFDTDLHMDGWFLAYYLFPVTLHSRGSTGFTVQ